MDTYIVIFTDLDGTLLSYDNYSFEEALDALDLIKEKRIPLVLCSSKTRGEIELYRERLENRDPFVSENGGGIFIPVGYFKKSPDVGVRHDNGYRVIIIGKRYSELRDGLRRLREMGFRVKGFGDMTVEEIVSLTGLSPEEARLSKERDFDEPFIVEDGADEERLRDAVLSLGLNFTVGRYYHLMGESDKGKAVRILTELYRKEFGDIRTIAIGDSPNDIPMLETVDIPVVVQKPGGVYDSRIVIPDIVRADGIGPDGWRKVIMELVGNFQGK
ncbi:glucosyl-3-phosphoglycerate/mannosyl-3-phosphoglycerate phosphatase [bacterium BMS3Bbin07]|nr:glucosyl-3-phosphoglycerate/mannosyl-3-phosphoglycerate phosphatase [bacterium BMS3Bbin07]